MTSTNSYNYMKRMATSLLIMALITYGMYTENPWLQYGSIFIILALQMGYQIIKNIRAGPLISANMEEATRVKRGKALFRVREDEVNRAKAEAKDGRGSGVGMGTMGMLMVPLLIFIVTGYILGILFPGIPRWQSYAVGFLISMPFSLILQAKSGIAGGLMVTPKSYYISRKGIAFDYTGRSYIVPFPLVKINMKKEANCIEVEGQQLGTTVIPNRLKLFTKDINKLHKILINFTEIK